MKGSAARQAERRRRRQRWLGQVAVAVARRADAERQRHPTNVVAPRRVVRVRAAAAQVRIDGALRWVGRSGGRVQK